MVAADALKKGLEIAYSLAPELQQRKILGDTIRIRQVPARSAAGSQNCNSWLRRRLKADPQGSTSAGTERHNASMSGLYAGLRSRHQLDQ